MLKAAADGDTKTVRDFLKATQPDAGPTLDLVARFITANQHAWTQAVAKFGAPAVMGLAAGGPNRPPVLMDMLMILGEKMEPRPDGGLHSQEMDILKADNGQFYIDLTTMVEENKKNPQVTQEIVPMSESAEKISKALTDNPNITIDELKAVIASH